MDVVTRMEAMVAGSILKGILIQDGKVGELLGSDGADFIFHVVLICGDDGDRVEGLQHIDPLVIIPESLLGAVLGFGIHGQRRRDPCLRH